MNSQAMRTENIRDTDFSAFACIEVAASLMSRRLIALTSNVRDLVRDINFDVRIKDRNSKRGKVS